MFFCPQKVEKTPQKVAYLWQLGVFFSSAPTAQNSPELHFRFMNYFIQPSLLESLLPTKLKSQIVEKSYLINTQRHAKKDHEMVFSVKKVQMTNRSTLKCHTYYNISIYVFPSQQPRGGSCQFVAIAEKYFFEISQKIVAVPIIHTQLSLRIPRR